ncbi:glycyl-tRNA synthetase [Zychaea mexicana]|uniref:glycyl-tRNA synthetase n=1 Tax=Zychaea mexicana TaxID=64656 RepID=UPI0022FF362C|nr:glycyl-tRNA synthetase [Zychaea mexicana]KAI9494530.1 glycyl-tRNA synthetase [Zychaea mexicana]
MATTAKPFDRAALEQLCTKRFFFAPAFAIYGGVAGFYDYGPTGCALMNNIISVWRNHFVLEEEMLELDTTIMNTYDVLKTSGHVDKFADWMCKDLKNGEIFRADHLVEAVLEARLQGDREARAAKEGAAAVDAAKQAGEAAKKDKKKKKKGTVVAVELSEEERKTYEEILAQIDNYGGPELAQIITKYNIRSPESGNELSMPQEFNLMFESQIGPTGQLKGFLRPETAQGQFLNFKKLLEFNNDKMPFASAQVGRAFRNEISPRSGLLRVREFTMAEIEHYVDPENKNHPGYQDAKDIVITLLPKDVQLQGKTETVEMSIGDAVEKKIIDNQTLGYFMARINEFLLKIGIKREKLRFRQHMDNEMAHYACDCWDAEIKTSYGWIECVGCADRSAYDLTVHSVRTKEKLVVREQLAEPRTVQKWQVEINKKTFGPKYKKNAKAVEEAILSYTDECFAQLEKDLESKGTAIVEADGQKFEVAKEDVSVKLGTITEHVREYTPNVIEPSFGIGRILYSLLEHSWWVREDDEARNVLSFPPLVAPFKCCILPLSGNAEFEPFVKKYSRALRQNGVSTRTDDSKASIGRRYSRNDELGIPYAITVDFQTVQDNTVTLRYRDSTKQIRDSFENILKIFKEEQ